jgi:hypothetical protein
VGSGRQPQLESAFQEKNRAAHSAQEFNEIIVSQETVYMMKRFAFERGAKTKDVENAVAFA